jgi:hypothetical protein
MLVFLILLGVAWLVYTFFKHSQEDHPTRHSEPVPKKTIYQREMGNPGSVSEQEWIVHYKSFNAMKAEEELKYIKDLEIHLPDRAYAFLRKKVEQGKTMTDEEFRKLNEE